MAKPEAPARMELLSSSANFIEIAWTKVLNVDTYCLQVSVPFFLSSPMQRTVLCQLIEATLIDSQRTFATLIDRCQLIDSLYESLSYLSPSPSLLPSPSPSLFWWEMALLATYPYLT
jgi:hypothetical protein